MSDLEMAILCAEAMGLRPYVENGAVQRASDHSIYVVNEHRECGYSVYNPLSNDSQAMALLKKFKMHVTPMWLAMGDERFVGWNVGNGDGHEDMDLNRAICEAVAAIRSQGAGK